jgi:hypothetical protein
VRRYAPDPFAENKKKKQGKDFCFFLFFPQTNTVNEMLILFTVKQQQYQWLSDRLVHYTNHRKLHSCLVLLLDRKCLSCACDALQLSHKPIIRSNSERNVSIRRRCNANALQLLRVLLLGSPVARPEGVGILREFTNLLDKLQERDEPSPRADVFEQHGRRWKDSERELELA